MAKFKATAAQTAAVESRGSAVLVSAGAGSGKTSVLTQRLMAYILGDEEADLDSFLVITFTRAAAGSLRGRIMEELAAALAADPGNRRLRRQSALCRRAQIGTIHSFCASLLRQHSHLLGLDPDFRVLDEERAAAMSAAALERTLESFYEKSEEHPGFLLLADTVGAGRDDRRLSQLVLSLREKMQCHARPEQWARQQVELLRAGAADVGETPWGREIMSRAGESVDYWIGQLRRLTEEMLGDPKMEKAYLPSFQGTLAALEELRRCLDRSWDSSRSCFPLPFERLGVLRQPEDEELAERAKARRKACKTAMDRLALSFQGDSARLLEELGQTEPAMSALLELTLAYDREYARDKRRAGLVDYGDLEHMAARLLTEEDGSPTDLARQLSLRYREIMVDEYQDVSLVQDAIFQALSRQGQNLFLVGDVKQSIYRFRLAEPEIFTDKYLRYQDAEQAGPGQPRRILLRENFRSRPEILDGANAVFGRCMSRSLGDVDYDQAAALRCGAPEAFPGPGHVPELLLLAAAEEAEDAPERRGREAALVARRIRALLDEGVTVMDQGRERPLRAGDVAILLRSGNSVGGVYRRALAALDIPVSAGQGGDFFRSVEVSTLMSMLAVVDDPHQDIPLTAVLLSPALGFSADELSRLRSGAKDVDLYGALLRSREQESCGRFLRLLESLRRQAPDLSAAELVWLLLEELDLLALCSAMSDGERRRARLMEMVSLAESFEGTGYRGVHRFVLWLRRLAEKEREPSLGAGEGEAVQIMTVHRSKGLEFPVVFLCDLARPFNKSDSYDTVLVHQALGLGPRVTDGARRVEYPSLARRAIAQRLERELLSEEMRLLYVAMTRAKDRLYMTASLRDPEKAVEAARLALSEPLEPELLASARSPAQWLISACLADGQRHLHMEICGDGAAAPERRVESPPPQADEAITALLRERLAYRYPYAAASALPSKVTATELKGRREPEEDAASLAAPGPRPYRMPDFGRAERPVSGAEKGVATHLVLQYMDFDKAGSLEAIQEEIRRLQEEGYLSRREAEAVDAQAVVELFTSSLGRRMREAQTLRREFRFSLLCDAGELFEGAAGEELLLQGVVDCFLVEDGAITVIDYKTDRLRDETQARQRARSYAGQLGAYARALERICGMPVKERILYFLSTGTAVSL